MELEKARVPRSFADALQLAADQARRLEIVEPAYNSLMKTETTMSITDAAKHFGVRPRADLLPYLRAHGYLTLSDLPTQRAIELDIMVLRQNGPDHNGRTHSQAVVKANQLERFESIIIEKLRREIASNQQDSKGKTA
jgi:phage antirepressor YoqD-like protein